jgi:hypothetical protein
MINTYVRSKRKAGSINYGMHEQRVLNVYRRPGFLAVVRFCPPNLLPPLSSQQVVSLSLPSCRRGRCYVTDRRGVGKEPNYTISRKLGLLYKSFDSLQCTYITCRVYAQ